MPAHHAPTAGTYVICASWLLAKCDMPERPCTTFANKNTTITYTFPKYGLGHIDIIYLPDFQRQQLADGRSVFQLVTALGDRANAVSSASDVGYVVGLTNASDVLAEIPDAPLLVPGLGAQGGDLAALAAAGRKSPDVINVSRGILYSDDDQTFAQRAAHWCKQIRHAYQA